MSSILGLVAAVMATESPSQPRPVVSHRTWTVSRSASCRFGSVTRGTGHPPCRPCFEAFVASQGIIPLSGGTPFRHAIACRAVTASKVAPTDGFPRRRGGRTRVASEWLSTADRVHWPLPPDGDGRPILLIPGFLAGDGSLSRMASWLRSGGFRTYRSGIAVNTACMEPLVERLEARLISVVERTGRPAVVLGQSRGGTLGRVLA